MANFLDLTTGLPALWAKIKSKFYTKAEVDAAIPTKVSSLTNDSGYLTSSTGVTGVKGSAESTYRKGNVNLTAANVGAVGLTGNETVGGNKTFSGLTTIAPDSVYNSATNSVIKANSSAIIQSSMPKYLWHDIWAFNQRRTPIYYTTTDGTTWTKQTLNSNVFIHKEAVPQIDVISSSIVGSRWLWSNKSTFGYCGGQWLVIGVAYSATIAKFNVLLESSTDEETWNTLCNSTNISANQQPIWIKTIGPPAANSIRLTITRHSDSANTTNLPIVSLRWLTSRWGDQGRGSEDEYPYQWDVNTNIYPIKNNTSSLGTSSYKWKNVYTNAVTGLSTPTSNDMAANKSYVDDTIDNTCLKKSGGQMTGKLTWANSGALPESSSLTYLLGIDAFADGGTTHWMNISNLNPLKVNGHTVNSDVPANAKFTDTTYTASSTAPKMDGTAAVGTSTAYARADHVHPTDTSRVAVNQGTANAGKVLTVGSNGNVTAAAIPDEVMIINISWDDVNKKYVADKTTQEIVEFVNNGGVAVVNNYGSKLLCNNVISDVNENYYYAGFYYAAVEDIEGSTSVYGSGVTIKYENGIESVNITQGNNSIPSPANDSDGLPIMNGTASRGDSINYARANHVHPSDTSRAAVADVLTKTNTTSYTPTADYHPATKKYVDDNVGVTSFNGNTGAITYTAPVTSVNSKTGAVVIDKIKTGSAQNSTEYQIMATPENDNHSSPVFVYDEVMATIAKYAGNYARLTLGTSTTPGVARLYSNDKVDYYTDIKASTASSNKTIVFPNADGTVALTSDILSNLSELSDTTISSPTNGQVLTYDSTTSKWINSTPSSGVTEARVNELIAAALAQYGDGDTATYGYNDASEVNY